MVGATVFAAALGCGSSVLPAPGYGGPPIEAGAVDSPSDGPEDAAKDAAPDTIMGAYGGPPIDAGGG